MARIWHGCSCGVDRQLWLQLDPWPGNFQTSICHGYGPKKQKRRRRKKKDRQAYLVQILMLSLIAEQVTLPLSLCSAKREIIELNKTRRHTAHTRLPIMCVWLLMVGAWSMLVITMVYVGVPFVAQCKTNPTSIHEDEGSILGLWRCCEL